jgi:hypothetical protein
MAQSWLAYQLTHSAFMLGGLAYALRMRALNGTPETTRSGDPQGRLGR